MFDNSFWNKSFLIAIYFLFLVNAVIASPDIQQVQDGNSISKPLIPFEPVQPEPVLSNEALHKEAERGDAEAQYDLGKMYASSKVVADEYNYNEAVKWYIKAAEQGHIKAQYALGEIYSSSSIEDVTQDYKEAAKWYIKAAEQGHVKAKFNLGLLCAQGIGIPKSTPKAIECFDDVEMTQLPESMCTFYFHAQDDPDIRIPFGILLEMAEKDPYSQGLIGYAYLKGYEVAKSCGKAIEWLSKAAESGDSNAQVILGIMYYKGDCVPQDFKNASNWFLKASKKGEKQAAYCLGWMYYKGQGFAQDKLEAINWFTDAEKQQALGLFKLKGEQYYGDWGEEYQDYEKSLNNYLLYVETLKEHFCHKELYNVEEIARVLHRLGQLYENGQGTIKNNEEAVKWYTAAAGYGHVNAQFTLGLKYANGDGIPQDNKKALKWWIKAAEQGDIFAQSNLGLMYQFGVEGVAKNDKEAVRWYAKAAEQGDATAQNNLGVLYASGRGVVQNYKEAVRWFTKAAEQGVADAQFNLGARYSNGQGVIEDYVEAYKWMLLAGMNGKDVSESKIWLQYRMTAEQIAEAQNRAKEFVYRKEKESGMTSTNDDNGTITAFGTGFFISKDGLFVTAAHVIRDAKSIRIYWNSKDYSAEKVFLDDALDVAVVKVSGIQSIQSLSLSSSSTVKTGDAVFTLGFPQVQLQGVEPKYTDGSISSLSGAGNDPKFFQISVPVQPGNSGGPLLDSRGRVVGLITARLDDMNTLLETGAIPQNVNYALKSSFILPLLESLPGMGDQLERSGTMDKSAAIEKAKNAVGLVICME